MLVFNLSPSKIRGVPLDSQGGMEVFMVKKISSPASRDPKQKKNPHPILHKGIHIKTYSARPKLPSPAPAIGLHIISLPLTLTEHFQRNELA